VTRRVAVVGLGAAGRRHLENLRSLGIEALPVRRVPGEGELGSLEAAEEWGASAIVVATPTAFHLEALRRAVDHGLHAYVEKPLSASSDSVDEVLRRAAERRLVVATGYNLRFHPALAAVRSAIEAGLIGRVLCSRAEVGQYLPDWHPAEDYRTSYAARRSLGGGALLTLSHELDYMRWIVGEVVSASGIARRVSALELDVDDVAEVICEHDGGAVSSIHADLLDRSYNRRARWVGESGSIAWGWGGPVVLHPDGRRLWEDPAFDVNETYRAALADFLDAIEGGRPPRCDGRDGLRVVELCEAVGGADVAPTRA
jgi:predicted dehydrogenase